MNRRLRPSTLWLAYCVVDGFLFRLMSTIFSVFLILEIGLDPFQLVFMGTILEASYLVFEVPTGVVADVISRRASVIVGLFGTGVAFFLLGLSHSFLVAAITQAVWGVFATFTSGADVAWLTDEVGEEAARPLYLKGDQAWSIGSLVGIVASVALATVSLALPIVLSGIGFCLLAAALVVLMPEEHFRKPEREEGRRIHHSFVQTFTQGIGEVRAHHVLLLILATAALHGASTEGFDRLSDLHVLTDIGLPAFGGLDRIVWFGVIDGVGLLLGLGALSFVKRRADLEGHAAVARVLMAIDALLVVSVIVFAVLGSFWIALAAFWVVGGLRSVRDPVFTAWINQGLDPATRATINSMGSQSDAIGQTVGGPGLGLIARSVSVPSAIVVSGLLSAPVILLYLRAIKRGTVGTLPPDAMQERLTLENDPQTETPELGPGPPP